MSSAKCTSRMFLLAFAVASLSSRANVTAEVKRMVLTPVNRYILDFSHSEGGGLPGGNFDNIAFNLDLHESKRSISLRRGERSKDIIASYDFADCTKGQESLLQKPLDQLAPGQAAWVDYIDIEMIPFRQEGVKWAGGVCFGYRNAGGSWHWHLATTPLTLDAATDRVRARIWVKEGNIDALKLVFDQSVPSQPIRLVTVATRPGELGQRK